MKVKKITFAGYEDVYNMEVNDIHNFAVEKGIIVHNCYDTLRYGIMHREWKPVIEEEKPRDRYAEHRRRRGEEGGSSWMGV